MYQNVKSEFVENPVHLKIKGVDHFSDSVINKIIKIAKTNSEILKVLFAKINGSKEIGRVEALASSIKEEFEGKGFQGSEQPFKPHMTLAKLSSHQKKVPSFLHVKTLLKFLLIQ